MKNISFAISYRAYSFMICLAIMLGSACNDANNKNQFYYSGDNKSGNNKIDITIPGDTLGILLNETISGFHESNKLLYDSAKRLTRQSLQQQGYQIVDTLSDRIWLVLGKKKNKTTQNLEAEARQLAANNKNLIANAGYLAYIKLTKKPIIITDELIIQFNPGTTQNEITSLFNDYGLLIKRQNPFVNLEYTVSVKENSPYDALKVSQLLKNNPKVQFAQLNFIHEINFNFTAPDYSDRQWNLENTGVLSTEDADIDAELAWRFTRGDKNTIIAVIDNGFDVLHDDLKNNLYQNPGEIPGNGIDDDQNTLPDDTIGWNFSGRNNNLLGGLHGTAVLGIAAADSNDFGVTGSCPDCSYILGKVNYLPEPCALAIDYARVMGAKIINLSWCYEGGLEIPTNIRNAISRATQAGIIVMCALTNSSADFCTATAARPYPDIASLPNVIGISSSTCNDMYDVGGFGNCLDLLAPTGTTEVSRGGQRIPSTDARGIEGYNDGTRDDCASANVIDADYTACFRGTSASTPLTAGVAGLILSLNPGLRAQQVQFLLQDCADKIENTLGEYSPDKGYSLKETHGYGRLNAYEAVKIASPDISIGGRNGVDIFVRDNVLDWGNTEQPSNTRFEPTRQFIGHWRSMDIKVDALPYVEESPGVELRIDNNRKFEELEDENIAGGQRNRVYVRIRNRGFRTAASVTVKLHWVHAGLGLPELPGDFWDRFPANASDISVWNPLIPKTISNLVYSGSSVAGSSDDDGSQIVMFELDAPVHRADLPNHYCLMAVIDSPDDPLVTPELRAEPNRLNMDFITSHYNNATHRNYIIVNGEMEMMQRLYMHNPYPFPIDTRLTVTSTKKIPLVFEDSSVKYRIHLKANDKKLITLRIDTRKLKGPAEITIEQLLIDHKKKPDKVIGGITFGINPTAKKTTKKSVKK